MIVYLVLTGSVETHFKKPRFLRFFKKPKKPKKLGFRVFSFFIFKSEFLLFRVNLCKFI